MLANDAIGLQEVMVVASMAISRKTPVAVSSIKPKFILEKLGAQEFPEILKSTPGVYAAKQGGAFGDSRINLRGFDQRNIAVMINGVPVNDMENGWVYWSNWAGLADVTRYMQVQRGLGASKIAVPSVGGTINIMTKTTDAVKGGSLITNIGNDGYQKLGLSLSSGLNENGWATSFSLARTTGNGYVDGTQFESYSYFANISKMVNEKHSLAFSIFGAPQWHGQRTSDHTIETFDDQQNIIRTDNIYLSGVHVGDAAQTTMALGVDWELKNTCKCRNHQGLRRIRKTAGIIIGTLSDIYAKVNNYFELLINPLKVSCKKDIQFITCMNYFGYRGLFIIYKQTNT